MDLLVDVALTILVLAIIIGISVIVIAFVTKVTYEIITELIDDINERRGRNNRRK